MHALYFFLMNKTIFDTQHGIRVSLVHNLSPQKNSIVGTIPMPQFSPILVPNWQILSDESISEPWSSKIIDSYWLTQKQSPAFCFVLHLTTKFDLILIQVTRLPPTWQYYIHKCSNVINCLFKSSCAFVIFFYYNFYLNALSYQKVYIYTCVHALYTLFLMSEIIFPNSIWYYSNLDAKP